MDSLRRNLDRVEALTASGQLPDGPLLLTSEEWIDAGRAQGGSDAN